ncbi:OstA family protein [Gloeothece citriformis PCC 7424]|uniref:OstA family protein n=1 Tax=Gloeothece citriformis (strain PCC 7424) TaxID=65393 RepID=B7KFR1_GLOC7|nr:DUF3769 domain-containing protein [Gloeothece citriformis]ACK73386.1 OstA family protein [Gloeothece citriformis PCC 7424]
MLPFVTLLFPLALIQPVSYEPSDRHHQSELAQNFQANTPQTPLSTGVRQNLPQSSVTPPVQPIPDVVEFHYGDSQTVPTVDPLDPPNPTGESAELLGDPISVDANGSSTAETELKPNKPNNTPSTETLAQQQSASSQVIFGLERKSGFDKHRLAKVVVTSKNNGQKQVFNLPLTDSKPTSNTIGQAPSEPSSPTPTPAQEEVSVIELTADQQEYDSIREIVTARGNVALELTNGYLTADRLQVNIPQRLAVAEGNVVLQRGDQIIRGDRFEYYFVEDSGIVFNANGEIYQPTLGQDFSRNATPDVGAGGATYTNLNDRLATNQPLQRVSTAGGYQFVFGTQRVGTPDAQSVGGGGGQINRIRFEAQELKFEGRNWDATDIRFTNDPFSPPELELRADQAQLRPVSPQVDEINLTNSRIVLDQRFSIPTQDRVVLDRRNRQPGILGFGYDGEERGGLYVERGFPIIDNPIISLQITPQYLIQKALFPDAFPTSNPTDESVSPLGPEVFGLVTDLNLNFSQRTSFDTTLSFSSLEFDSTDDYLRSKVRFLHRIGRLDNPYVLNVEYNYRERLYNGSLGYQTVENSVGAVITSPSIPIGDTGISLTYQGSIQSIEAPTDRQELLGSNLRTFPDDFLVTLTRTQGAATLNRSFLVWTGQALPPTPEEGLRFTPTPVLPFLSFYTVLTGVASFYGNGDTQPSLTATVGINGQVGNFSRNFLDFTGFNLSYSQGLRGDESPFFFDRFVDQSIISAGLTQQIYGPVRLGVQTSYSLDQDEEISTDFVVEWSRRTYSILLRYNPVLELGSINLRISDFNWTGNPGLFEGTLIRPVVDGVRR